MGREASSEPHNRVLSSLGEVAGGFCSPRLNGRTNRMCWTPYSFFQSRFSVLTQISPFLATFGWKILVRKYPVQGASPGRRPRPTAQRQQSLERRRKERDENGPLGGVVGKSSLSVSLMRKAPPAYGVCAVLRPQGSVVRLSVSQARLCLRSPCGPPHGPGPAMTAWMSVMSSSLTNTLIPSGGSRCMSCISFASRFSTAGAKFSADAFERKQTHTALTVNISSD